MRYLFAIMGISVADVLLLSIKKNPGVPIGSEELCRIAIGQSTARPIMHRIPVWSSVDLCLDKVLA